MKYLLNFLILLSLQQTYCQSSDSKDFKLKVTFEKAILVKEIQPYYCLKNGNHMEDISYIVDTLDNSISLAGYNSYIHWVAFLALVFVLKDSITLPVQVEKLERTTYFYLLSQGPLSSYTGEQTVSIHFSYEKPIIIASLDYHNGEHAFKELKMEKRLHFSGDYHELYLGNEMIKIGEQQY